MPDIISVFLHLDTYLPTLISTAGNWTYSLLFLVVFCETGLVVSPFLPGDSLLFAAGTIAALGALELPVLVLGLILAAVLGDAFNYWIGRQAGLRLLQGPLARFVNPCYLEKANRFYAKYGAKAIVLARFVPIMRTIAPFTAGIAKMDYRRFAMYNVIGAVAWVLLFTVGGYLFGNIPIVKENFSIVILAIIVISILPAAVEWWRARGGEK